MNNDPGLSSLLKWSIENSSDSTETSNTDSSQPANPTRGLDPEVIARLMGGPSDADLMRAAMQNIASSDIDLDNKLIAFDNFEQLIENLDNANNMDPLGLWDPLVAQLDSPEPQLQLYAAWCLGTAVQNNIKCQERCLTTGAVPKLVTLSLHGSTPAVRRKAIYALSSEVRNFQRGLDALVTQLPPEFRGEDRLDAEDMAAVDVVIDRLRNAVPKE